MMQRAFPNMSRARFTPPSPDVRGRSSSVFPKTCLPRDTNAADVAAVAATRPTPSADSIAALREMIAQAERPLAILGGSGWTEKARTDVTKFLEAWAIPSTCGFRRQDRIDNRSSVYAGYAGIGIMPQLAARIREADLIIAIGSRLSEAVTQGYTLLEVPRPKQRLIHVHPDPDELGRVYQADLVVNAGMPELGLALRSLAPPSIPWRKWTEQMRGEYEHSRNIANREAVAREGYVDMATVVAYLDANLPDDAIITTGAGNFAGWVHRFYRYRGFGTQLGRGKRLHGLRLAVRGRREDHVSRAHLRRVLRRRRFLDDGTRARNGDERARSRDCDRCKQRDVRHDPHAPRARASRPRHRDRSRESEFREIRRSLRRIRRARFAPGRFSCRIRTRRKLEASRPSSKS